MRFTVPEVPPSVNHYKTPIWINTRDGKRLSFALTPEAEAFRFLLAYYAGGQSIIPETEAERRNVRYSLHAKVYLGPGQRGDGDNFWKCIADSLTNAGVIHSDARVRRWYLEVIDDDRAKPRTEIRAAIMRLPKCPTKPKKRPRQIDSAS